MKLVLLAVIASSAACEPDLDATAFLCDTERGCPSDQTCIDGRCRRMAPIDIGCDQETCRPDQQCCADLINGARCILATEICPGDTALCDGRNDCTPEERCCNGETTTVCALDCASSAVACTTDNDCPSDAIHCCEGIRPWGECSNTDC